MTPEKLKEIIESHGRWLRDEPEGSRANLSSANLYGADLYGANLSSANLSRANLYGANGLPDVSKHFDFFDKLERTSEGFICYKTFGEHFKSPQQWKIKEGSIINEFTDMSPYVTCSYGVNVATKEWVKRETSGQMWKCLIKFEWLVGAVIPNDTDGKFRTSRVQLIEQVDRNEL